MFGQVALSFWWANLSGRCFARDLRQFALQEQHVAKLTCAIARVVSLVSTHHESVQSSAEEAPEVDHEISHWTEKHLGSLNHESRIMYCLVVNSMMNRHLNHVLCVLLPCRIL